MSLLGGLIAGFCVAIGVSFIRKGFGQWQGHRSLEDTATESVRGAAAGRTELAAIGRPLEPPLRRLLADEPCLATRYTIERRDGDDWDWVGRWTVTEPFQVDDGTGTMHVEPDDDTTFGLENTMYGFNGDNEVQQTVEAGAETPAHIARFLRHHTDGDVPDNGRLSATYRYSERWIPAGAKLYLVGSAEPAEVGETNSSGLVLRRDEANDEFIATDRREALPVTRTTTKVLLPAGAGLLASVMGVYVLTSAWTLTGFLGCALSFGVLTGLDML
jgi:hypothetical protein